MEFILILRHIVTITARKTTLANEWFDLFGTNTCCGNDDDPNFVNNWISRNQSSGVFLNHFCGIYKIFDFKVVWDVLWNKKEDGLPVFCAASLWWIIRYANRSKLVCGNAINLISTHQNGNFFCWQGNMLCESRRLFFFLFRKIFGDSWNGK